MGFYEVRVECLRVQNLSPKLNLKLQTLDPKHCRTARPSSPALWVVLGTFGVKLVRFRQIPIALSYDSFLN